MRIVRCVIASLLLASAITACERVVDLTPQDSGSTPPDSGSPPPDAAVSDDADLWDASVGGDGEAALSPDASPDAL